MEEREIAEEYRKNSENRFRNLMSKVSWVHFVLVGVGALIILSISKNNSDPRYNYIIYAVLIGVILVLWFKPSKQKVLLSKSAAIRIAQEELNNMKRVGREIPFDSVVVAGPQCHLRHSDNLAEGFSDYVAWDVEFKEYVNGTQLIRNGYISVHCYEGIVTGLFWLPFGFNSSVSKDKVIVPVGVVQGTMSTNDYGQPKK